MSVKASLLALLAERPMYGAQLRAEFESRTGGTWPLNVGQVYTTLGRLERDGLVEPAGPADGEGRISYRLTAMGRAETAAWWDSPVPRGDAPRDELVIKLALAIATSHSTRRRPPIWPGAWCWRTTCSRRKPRSDGSITSRRPWPGTAGW